MSVALLFFLVKFVVLIYVQLYTKIILLWFFFDGIKVALKVVNINVGQLLGIDIAYLWVAVIVGYQKRCFVMVN